MITPFGLSAEETDLVLTAACRAPSLYNSQPWAFVLTPDRIELHLNADRALTVSDPDGREGRIACGAVLFNLTLALARHGVAGRVTLPPDIGNGPLAIIDRAGDGILSPERAELERAITRRRTNRQPFFDLEVSLGYQQILIRAAEIERTHLQMIIDPAQLSQLHRWAATSHRQQLADPAWSAEWAAWTGRGDSADGVPAVDGHQHGDVRLVRLAAHRGGAGPPGSRRSARRTSVPAGGATHGIRRSGRQHAAAPDPGLPGAFRSGARFLDRPRRGPMKAREVMSQPVITIRADAALGVAADILTRHGFTGLPVTDDDDHLVGIVTEADLLRERLDAASDPVPPTEHHLRWRRHPTVVGDVMTTTVESLTPSADTSELARLMLEERIRCVPIVDGRQILGIVTRRDLLRAGVIRSDADLAADISRELAAFSDPDRWSVSVERGLAEIQDHLDNANDRRIAVRLALALPGVNGARAHYLTSDPF